MAEDKKRYNFLENTINAINGKFISLDDEDVKQNNEVLCSVLDIFINKMKDLDPLFKAMYTNPFYGGSFYDGLRVKKPDEFDLDLRLRLPKYAEPVITISNVPSFAHVQLKNFHGWMKQPEALVPYKNFGRLFEEGTYYLDAKKVLSWVEGLVQRVINDLPTGTGEHNISVSFSKQGPAMTLEVSTPNREKVMDVDLVVCFEFGENMWPKNGIIPNPVPSKPNFFVVGKMPKTQVSGVLERYWRLSFPEQERVLIDNKGKLKPTIRMLKKLRDTLGHDVIASYYIKNVLLNIIDKKNNEFWQNSLSYVFMTILKEYREDFIEKGKIPYYWNKKDNLIDRVNRETLININNKLKLVINDIEKNTQNPKTIAKHLLSREEYNLFMMETM